MFTVDYNKNLPYYVTLFYHAALLALHLQWHTASVLLKYSEIWPQQPHLLKPVFHMLNMIHVLINICLSWIEPSFGEFNNRNQAELFA